MIFHRNMLWFTFAKVIDQKPFCPNFNEFTDFNDLFEVVTERVTYSESALNSESDSNKIGNKITKKI